MTEKRTKAEIDGLAGDIRDVHCRSCSIRYDGGAYMTPDDIRPLLAADPFERFYLNYPTEQLRGGRPGAGVVLAVRRRTGVRGEGPADD